MTLKSAFTNTGDVAFINIQETYGGQNIEWGPVFKSHNPSVMDALQQARTIHEITK